MKVDHIMVDKGATHVVVGIDWGANCNISCRYENKANKSEKEVNVMLEGPVTKIKTSLEVQFRGEIDFTDEDYMKRKMCPSQLLPLDIVAKACKI